jgi:hypothetical protein
MAENPLHGKGINRLADFLSDEYKAGRKFMGFKPVEPGLTNAYIGLKPTKPLMAAVAIGAAVYAAAGSAWNGSVDKSQMLRSKGQDVGNLSAMSYDAVGNVSAGRRDLGATGDLVFGLHNMRRGG